MMERGVKGAIKRFNFPWKLLFGAFCATATISILFSTIFYGVEGSLTLEAYLAIVALATMLCGAGLILFFAGDDATELAKYHFFKEKGGGLIMAWYTSDRTLVWGFHRIIPKVEEFQKRGGQDEAEWAELINKPYHIRGSGVPVYNLKEGLPYNFDILEANNTDIAPLMNKTIILSEMRGKIDALRSFLKKLENIAESPKMILLIVLAIVAAGAAAFIGYNILQLLIAVAQAQGIDPSKYLVIIG